MESLLRENRVSPPPAEFAAKAHVKSLEQYEGNVPAQRGGAGGFLGRGGRVSWSGSEP